jgi:enediyne biosynthesis protein E4
MAVISAMAGAPSRRSWLLFASRNGARQPAYNGGLQGKLCLIALAAAALAQGPSSRNVAPAPRAAPSGRPWPVSLTDIAAEAGLTAPIVYGGDNRKKYILEANGAGVAFLDYDNDARLDIFVVNGSRVEAIKGSTPVNHLYRNTGGNRFEDVTRAAGVDRSGWGSGVCIADFDNDGFDDLYVTYFGRNVLYRNTGNGTFEDVTAHAGVGGSGQEWSTGCTFLDYDRDGRLDLLVTTYQPFAFATTPAPGSLATCMWRGMPVFCGPRGLPYGRLILYHNRGDGTFEDVSTRAGVRGMSRCYALTAVAADFDGDGWTDAYIACDSSPSILLRNRHNGTFTDVGTESGVAYSENGAEQGGMGVAVADYDNDGRLDIVKTNFAGDYPNLYRNLGRGAFEDLALRAGLGVNPQYVAWGVGLIDFDNDGWRDLFQVNGHVYPEMDRSSGEERYRNPRLLYRNLGNGRFEDMSASSGAGVTALHSSRGAAFGDIDNDGAIDVLIMNMGEPPSLLRNRLQNRNHWIKVKLEGTTSNRSAIGATVTALAGTLRQTAAVLSQSSYLSHDDSRLHFGLGAAERADGFVVRWPNGVEEKFGGATADGLVLLKEGTGQAQSLPLPR